MTFCKTIRWKINYEKKLLFVFTLIAKEIPKDFCRQICLISGCDLKLKVKMS